MRFILTEDTLLYRVGIEWADMFLVVGIVFLFFKIRESLIKRKSGDDAEPDGFDFYRDTNAVNPTAYVKSICGLMMLCNAVLSGTSFAIDKLTGYELMEDRILFGHMVWAVVFGVVSFFAEIKLMRSANANKKVDKVLTGIYQYLRSLTDAKEAKVFMRFVCELMDTTKEPDKLLELIDELSGSDKTYLEIGDYATHAIINDFMHPGKGASGWFHLSEQGKQHYARISELLELD